MKSTYIESFKAGLKPDPYINFAEWADQNFRLTPEASVEPGKYRTSRTPWVIEILEELSPQSPINEVVVIKPTQMGYTTVASILILGTIDRYPGPIAFAQATEGMVIRYSKKKLGPTIDSMPHIKSKITGDTILLKEFLGGSISLFGTNSGTSARSDSVKVLIVDDYNAFTQDVGDEGGPGDLLKKRCDAFGDRKKIYINSTPTLKGVGLIEDEWSESSQGYFHLPCPHCEEFQFLIFGGVDSKFGIKFSRDRDGQVTDAWYVCKHCYKRIDEFHKTEMLKKGKYIHKYPNRKKRGFKINSQYSPLGWVSWVQIADEFLKAAKKLKRGDSKPMQVWVNTRQAESWEEDGTQPQWNILSNRAESYNILEVPSNGLCLIAAVDTQDDRLEFLLVAYGRGEECWIIYQATLYGDPDSPEVWKKLDELLFRTYKHESGAELMIESMGIDTGGHRAQAVYNYCRSRGPVVFALKGASQAGKPIISSPTKQDLNFKGVKIKKGVALWSIGTDVGKGTIYNRLKLKDHGPGFVHFPVGLPEEFYKQLTAEKLVKSYDKKGFPVLTWKKVRERNDVLDCMNYVYAAAIKVGLSRKNWDQLENNINNSIKEIPQKSYRSKEIGSKNPLTGRNLNPRNRR